jgi:hypothetical protein
VKRSTKRSQKSESRNQKSKPLDSDYYSIFFDIQVVI